MCLAFIAATHRGSACAISSARRIVSKRIGGSLSTTVHDSTRDPARSTTATNPTLLAQSNPTIRAARDSVELLARGCTMIVPKRAWSVRWPDWRRTLTAFVISVAESGSRG